MYVSPSDMGVTLNLLTAQLDKVQAHHQRKRVSLTPPTSIYDQMSFTSSSNIDHIDVTQSAR